MADAQPGGGAGQPGVELDVEAEAGSGEVLDDHVVGAGDEDAAGRPAQVVLTTPVVKSTSRRWS